MTRSGLLCHSKLPTLNTKNTTKQIKSPHKYHTHRILLVFTPFFEFDDNFFHQLVHRCVGRRTHEHAVLLDLGVRVFIEVPPPLVPQFATGTRQTKNTNEVYYVVLSFFPISTYVCKFPLQRVKNT